MILILCCDIVFCLFSNVLTFSLILSKLADTYLGQSKHLLGFGDIDLIFKISRAKHNSKKGLSVLYLLNQQTELDPTDTGTILGIP